MSDDLNTRVVHDPAEAGKLIAAGATLQRHAHQMSLVLPLQGYDDPEFLPFAPDANPPVPWEAVMPSFEAAYPVEHPDHMPGGASLIDTYFIPYTAGAKLGALICHASALAVRDGRVYGGILIVDRPGEGPWVCDIWRHPDPAYAGAGVKLLRWAAGRLTGHASLGLVVTVGNDAALRAYERVGFAIDSTAWTVRLP